MSKSRKSLSSWLSCDRCESTMTQKELTMHDGNCPPSSEEWIHGYIRDRVLYSTMEAYAQEQPKYISERETNNMIFMAPMAMELCQVPIGDPVLVKSKESAIVKTAWPTDNKTLLGVSMTKKAIETSRIDGPVKVSKLSSGICIADEITISYTGKSLLPKVTPELEVRIKNYNERHIFTIGNRISVPYYGKNLAFKIIDIRSDELTEDSKSLDITEKLAKIRLDEDASKFYKSLYSTKWRIVSEKNEIHENAEMTIEDLGGYETLVGELRERMNIALGRWRTIRGFDVPRGILIYGTSGVGKSTIARAVMSEYKEATIFPINGREIGTCTIADGESRLTEIFENSKIQSPSIIFIRDIEKLCPRKGNTNHDADNRVIEILAKLIDDLRLRVSRVAIIATASRRELVNGTFRRAGRLDVEFEVSSPTPQMREKILRKFIDKMPNNLSNENIERIAFTTHGFLASDLYALCSDATTFAAKRSNSNENREITSDEVIMELEDFDNALRRANPSAMNEVVVDVPDVKFSEIGGQKNLKLKLKQAVEWPHRHPEVFARLGITPPRGLLMFGPPGCSKTMIAKALATESKLNFINVKGPELFSKWVGDSERAVREIFRKARQVAPSIIFIDEIDALGGERGSSSSSGGSNVQERVLTQLLTELDGVTALGNVTLVAATNRPDRIDKALLRPGRFDRIVYVPLPDADTRREIFDIKFKKMPIADEVNVEDLVDLSEGYSGAEVQAICYEAAMKALEESLDAEIITKEHFKAAFAIVTPRTPPSLIQLYENYMINYNMNK